MTATAEVLLIANNFPPVRGGSAAVYANLARCAADRITVLAPRINYADGLPLIGWREFDRRAKFRIARLTLLRTIMGVERSSAGKLLFVAQDFLIRTRLFWTALRLLARERPGAVCIGELLASGWMIRFLHYLPGVRTVVYVHGEEITTDNPYDPDCARRRRALMAADCVIVVSRFTERAVRKMLGERSSEQVVLVGNGVDSTRFSPAPRDAQLVERHGLGGMFVFVTVCRLLEKKGVDNALRAFAALLPAYPDTRYLIVGTGPYESALHKLAAELGVAGAVVFVGDVAEDELVEHYRLGDVFLMPNRALPDGDTEGFGLVFLEANACGLAVIAGCDGGSMDAVSDGANGLIVDGHAVPAIGEAMQRLRSDDGLRRRLGQAGLATAAGADWSRQTEAFLLACGRR
jgi:phosphatidylinositol alpha-1,6-mannosyltransferase